jgi:hypothetical protein
MYLSSIIEYERYMFNPSQTSDLIILIILGEEYRLRSSFFCNFFSSPLLLFLGSNILIGTLFSKTLRKHNYILNYYKLLFLYQIRKNIWKGIDKKFDRIYILRKV